MKGHLPPGAEADWELSRLRSTLISRTEHWKAEARKYVAERQEQVAGLATLENTARPGITAWEELEITFISDKQVQIVVAGEIREPLNYDELGFADHRSKNPNKAWLSLKFLADNCGTISDSIVRKHDRPKIEKRMQAIRAGLRKHFCLEGDPLPYARGTGYQALFKISTSPSFST